MRTSKDTADFHDWLAHKRKSALTDTTTTTLMTKTLLVQDPSCRTEQAVDAYLQELKAMLMLSFKEQPLRKVNPYAVIGRSRVKMIEIEAAAAARESSKLRRLYHEKAVLDIRANLELEDIETGDLL